MLEYLKSKEEMSKFKSFFRDVLGGAKNNNFELKMVLELGNTYTCVKSNKT